jgi:type IV secretory pathway component VirB8
MRELRSRRWIVVKALALLLIAVIAAGSILLASPSVRTARSGRDS